MTRWNSQGIHKITFNYNCNFLFVFIPVVYFEAWNPNIVLRFNIHMYCLILCWNSRWIIFFPDLRKVRSLLQRKYAVKTFSLKCWYFEQFRVGIFQYNKFQSNIFITINNFYFADKRKQNRFITLYFNFTSR